jgi:hypothetical protein
MMASTLLLLSSPSSRTDRARLKLVAAAVAVDGALLLVCERIARLRGEISVEQSGLGPFVANSDNRTATMVGGLLLCIPVGALFLQSVRVGATARARGLAALRLAGATPREVRWIAGVEMARASLLGGALSGPAYIGLWLALGVLAPAGARFIPPPDLVDFGAWLLVLVISATAGGLAGTWVHRQVIAEPLSIRHRARARVSGRRSVRMLILCVAMLTSGSGGWFRGSLFAHPPFDLLVGFGFFIALLLGPFVMGPWVVLLTARVLRRRGRAVPVLAGARLAAEPRAPGRVVAVLLLCGGVLGLDGILIWDLVDTLRHPEYVDPVEGLGLQVSAIGLIAAGTLIAALAVVATLLVGATDQLLDARRPLACLSALGADQTVITRTTRRQLVAAAVPGAVVGPWLVWPVLFGMGGPTLFAGDAGFTVELAAVDACTSLVFGSLTAVVASLSARALQPQLTAAMDPDILRTP